MFKYHKASASPNAVELWLVTDSSDDRLLIASCHTEEKAKLCAKALTMYEIVEQFKRAYEHIS